MHNTTVSGLLKQAAIVASMEAEHEKSAAGIGKAITGVLKYPAKKILSKVFPIQVRATWTPYLDGYTTTRGWGNRIYRTTRPTGPHNIVKYLDKNGRPYDRYRGHTLTPGKPPPTLGP